MNQYLFTPGDLTALCKDDDIKDVQKFIEQTLPVLPKERQKAFCSRLSCDSETCNDLPCTARTIQLLEAAAQGGQVEVFTYLWDTFLAPRGITSIPYPCLRTAAFQGAIPLAQAYWSRDPDCFKAFSPPAVHPPRPRRPFQVATAIRSDRFEYIDFMLAHGADINAGFPANDLLRMVVRCAVDDATTLRRLQFLVSRGAKTAGSGALREVVAADCIELASCLLDGGADVDDVVEPERTSSLMVAAGEGYEEMVKLLLDRGADTETFDREGRNALAIANRSGRDSIVKLLERTNVSRGFEDENLTSR